MLPKSNLPSRTGMTRTVSSALVLDAKRRSTLPRKMPKKDKKSVEKSDKAQKELNAMPNAKPDKPRKKLNVLLNKQNVKLTKPLVKSKTKLNKSKKMPNKLQKTSKSQHRKQLRKCPKKQNN